MARKIPGRALDSNTSITVNAISFGSNVTVNTTSVALGNSTVNTVINSTSVSVAGGATFSGNLMPSANITYDIGNTTMRWRDLYLSGATINLGGATIQTDSNSGAIAIIPKPTADKPNPTATIFSANGDVSTATSSAGALTAAAIGEKVAGGDTKFLPRSGGLLSGDLLFGNNTVNATINSTSVSTVKLNVGSDVFVNTSTIHLGNSTVNTVIHTTGFTGNGAGLHSVNAATLDGNTVANILTAANTAANTLANAAYTNAITYSGNAAQAFSNAATRADSAYSNAITYAASNTYVNSTFLLLTGGTITGTITVGNSTVNSVVNSTAASLGNTTINGFVNVSSNLTVTSVAAPMFHCCGMKQLINGHLQQMVQLM